MADPAIKVVAMPMDANPDGDVFGGWLLSMMDLAAYIPARKVAKHRIVTVAMDNIQFHKPVFVGDCLECYATIEKIGNTSMTVKVEAFVERKEAPLAEKEKVTEGRFVVVAIDDDRRPIKIGS